MMLAKEFRKILDEYSIERSKDFKSSDFAKKFAKNLCKEFNISNDFVIRPSCGQSTWAEKPWITITHKSFDSAQESFQIEYKLDCENGEVTLSIIPRLESYEEYRS